MPKHECSQVENINNLKSNQTQLMDLINKIDWKIDTLTTTVNEMKVDIAKNFLTKEEAKESFASKRAERIIFWLVGIMLLRVLNNILWLVK